MTRSVFSVHLYILLGYCITFLCSLWYTYSPQTIYRIVPKDGKHTFLLVVITASVSLNYVKKLGEHNVFNVLWFAKHAYGSFTLINKICFQQLNIEQFSVLCIWEFLNFCKVLKGFKNCISIVSYAHKEIQYMCLYSDNSNATLSSS